MEQKAKNSELRVIIIFTGLLLAFGIAMLVLSLTVFGKPLFWDEVGGTIAFKTADSVKIAYQYNNVNYFPVEIKNVSVAGNIGDIISIRVNPVKPTEITILKNVGLLVVMFALSGVMLLGGIALPIYYLIKSKKVSE